MTGKGHHSPGQPRSCPLTTYGDLVAHVGNGGRSVACRLAGGIGRSGLSAALSGLTLFACFDSDETQLRR
jgi:hypothetical protein